MVGELRGDVLGQEVPCKGEGVVCGGQVREQGETVESELV
jgi:hypothetical protein